jgi:cell wall-associated NlpC family hydrolase
VSIAAVTSHAAATKTVKHTIKSGESLYTIAKNNHTTIDKLCQLNDIKRDEVLKVGRALKVPTEAKTVKSRKKSAKKTVSRKKHIAKKHTVSKKYVVKSGDTLSTLAQKHHTTVDALRKANNLKKGQYLKLGQALTIPSSSTVKKTAKTKVAKKVTSHKKHIVHTYVVKSGDTLSTLAQKHHTTVTALRKANNLKKGQYLKLGQSLTIPGTATVQKHKKTRVAKRTSKKAEKKLAKMLSRHSSKRVAKVNVKKSRKFSLSDIVFGNRDKLPAKSKKIISLAKQKLGKRYVWGATGQRNTFDCSGFTTYVCKKNGICLPRRAIQQSKVGKPVKRSELQPGDLVFFDTSKNHRGYVNHVGIYIGNGKFIHASSAKKKVIITSLNKPFYSQRFKGARRVASL